MSLGASSTHGRSTRIPALRRRGRIFFFALIALIAPLGVAHAQSVAPPATHYTIDANGVDVIQGQVFLQSPSISVGQPQFGGLSYFRTYDSGIQDWRDNVTGSINSSGSAYVVTLMGAAESFTLASGVFTSDQGTGATLTLASGIYTYTTSNGTIASFDTALAGTQPVQANVARVTSMTLPDGEVRTFTYTTLTGSGFLAQRLQSVTNTLGYQLSFTYASNSADATGITLTKVTALNNAVEYCSPTANGCTLTNTWPSLTFAINGSGYQTVTDALSRTTTYAIASGIVVGIFWPDNGTGTPTRTFGYSSGKVATVYNGSALWSYSYSTSGSTRTTTVVDPNSVAAAYVSNTSTNRLTSVTDSLNNTTSYLYDSLGRQTRVTAPEGNYTNVTYDARGNITEERQVAKSGSGLSDIVETAAFDSTCSNQITCNQPNSTTDARGYRTDYTYDSTHGGVLTVTQPAPSGSTPIGSGTRPQTRYAYTQYYAWYKNSGGTIVQAPSQVYRLTSTSACATNSSCSGGSDETLTTIGYGTGSSSQANNRLPATVSRGAGDSSLTATVAMAFTADGDLQSSDGPLSGSGDTTVFHYDALRQRTGIVGPDPDSGGSRHNRALRYTYDGDGQVTKVERGTVPSQSDSDWTSHFTTLEELDTTYNGLAQRVQDAFAAGGTTYNVTQYSYDSANRPACTAVRMNPSIFGSLPSSACTLGTEGSNGPDRITRNVYDQVNRVIQVQSAYGTSLQQTTATQTWSNNSQLATLADANGNLTTYVRDGFDRVSKIQFPSATTTGTSNTSDYEQYGYDANSNVTSDRRRDGTSFALTYDNLNRLITADAPTGTADVDYAYDLFGRVTQAQTSTQTLTWGYDQLSRNTSAGAPLGTVSYEYDLADHRTKVTWPDSFFAQYDYDLTGAVTAISQNPATSGSDVLVTYAYDDYGRRTSITRYNGVTTTYSYDGSTRLSSLAHDLASTGSDQTLSYTYNAANQQLTRTGTNSSYVYTPPTNYAYTPANGLNQIASSNGTAFTYSDARGNLTSDGTTTYGYDAYNRMVSAGTPTLSYDPAGRLSQTTGSATKQFLYDGSDVIAEYDNTSPTPVMQRRFVHGPGLDEPVVWYEGSGTTDRRWLVQNEQNTVIAITNASGAALNINTYDAYGVRGTSNAGLFQYTGQLWLTDIGLYSFKARIYSAALGRFMQTDPILQNGGLNIYAYVGNDPVNSIDPSGLDQLPKPDGGGWRDCGNGVHCPEPGFTVCATCSPFGQNQGNFAGLVHTGHLTGGAVYQLVFVQTDGDDQHCPSGGYWQVTPAPPEGGVVVQQVTGSFTSSSGGSTFSWGGFEGGGQAFWTISPGNQVTNRYLHTRENDDSFNANRNGTMTVHTQAYFYAGQTTPPGFRANNPGTLWSHNLPSSRNGPPPDWTPSSNAVNRDVICHTRGGAGGP